VKPKLPMITGMILHGTSPEMAALFAATPRPVQLLMPRPGGCRLRPQVRWVHGIANP
jgi:hypothetical protein